MTSMDATAFGMVSPAIFEHLQTKIDEDTQIREDLRNILTALEKQGWLDFNVALRTVDLTMVLGRTAQSVLSRAHSTPSAQRWFLSLLQTALTDSGTVQGVLSEAEKSILGQIETISKLAEVASKYPYYKYNSIWTRDVQNSVGKEGRLVLRETTNILFQCFAVLLCCWLGGLPTKDGQGQPGRLLTIEEVGEILQGEAILPMPHFRPNDLLYSASEPQGSRRISSYN